MSVEAGGLQLFASSPWKAQWHSLWKSLEGCFSVPTLWWLVSPRGNSSKENKAQSIMSLYEFTLGVVISAVSYLLHICPIQSESELKHWARRQGSLRPSSRLVLHAFKIFNCSQKFFILQYLLLFISIQYSYFQFVLDPIF